MGLTRLGDDVIRVGARVRVRVEDRDGDASSEGGGGLRRSGLGGTRGVGREGKLRAAGRGARGGKRVTIGTEDDSVESQRRERE